MQVGRVSEWFNPSCFTLEPAGTFGDTGRDTGRGPGFYTVDFAVLKDTRITESVRAQFRAEFFNITNHQNLALPVSTVFTTSRALSAPNTIPYGINSSAGTITSIVGTARQIQFALKLLFCSRDLGQQDCWGKPRRSQAWAPVLELKPNLQFQAAIVGILGKTFGVGVAGHLICPAEER